MARERELHPGERRIASDFFRIRNGVRVYYRQDWDDQGSEGDCGAEVYLRSTEDGRNPVSSSRDGTFTVPGEWEVFESRLPCGRTRLGEDDHSS